VYGIARTAPESSWGRERKRTPFSRVVRLCLSMMLLGLAANCTRPSALSAQTPSTNLSDVVAQGQTFYVSPNGNGADGRSWATAWKDTTSIAWAGIPAGSTIYLDGGTSRCSVSPYDFAPASPDPGVSCGTRYSPFVVGQDDVSILRSTQAGHNGTVVIDGGRDTPLPYCHQPSYSASAGAAFGIDLGGHTDVVINGQNRSGIVVRGAQDGVNMGVGGHDTLANMELFDNGYPTTILGGYNSDGNNILFNGPANIYDRLLIHDGGQDEFHSASSAVSEGGSVIENSWIGNLRENPLHPGHSFNGPESAGCQHVDGVQIFEPGTTIQKLTISWDLFGPGLNQGLYPSDGGTGTTFDNVTVSNTLFLDAESHNLMTDTRVNNWFLNRVTIFATQGGTEIPTNGTTRMTNSIKAGGYWYTPGPKWLARNDIWYGGERAPGVHMKPQFVRAPRGAAPRFALLESADLRPTCRGCAAMGSPLRSWHSIFARIDTLNGGF